MTAGDDTTILNYILTGGGAALITQIANAVINRKSRQTADARSVIAGSVEWANAVHEDYQEMRDELREVKVLLRGIQAQWRVHAEWDVTALGLIRRDIDPLFPEPPTMEAAS